MAVTAREQTGGDAAGQAGADRLLFAGPARNRDCGGPSRFVALMKLILPALALGIVALIVLWPQMLPDQARLRLGEIGASLPAIDVGRMDRPRFVGVTRRHQPYQVTADQARQAEDAAHLVHLVSPKAKLTDADDNGIALSAASGIYNKETGLTELAGGVTVRHAAGFRFSTEAARIDFQQGSVAGDTPVRGEGPRGRITGAGFRIHDNGARILVTGKSRLTLFPARRAGRS